jgi:hypothetical protein
MERMARPLLIGLLAWLLVLTTGVFSSGALGTSRGTPPNAPRPGRPYIPGKKGVIHPRNEGKGQLALLLKAPVPGMSLPEPSPPSLLCRSAVLRAEPGQPVEPLYLLLRTLLL